MDYKKLSSLIQTELFEEDDHNTPYPKICNLHDSFDNCDFIGDSEKSHNCLGCNYANYTWGLLHTIESWSMYE